ncbi:MAG: phosphoenolpyruvate synthase [Candidatus Woesearchaeota archaeon]
MDKQTAKILWFDQLSINDVPLVGGKNASLGEMYRELSGEGVKVPNGFAVTANAYRYFLASAGLPERIQEILSDLDTSDMENLSSRGQQVRNAILAAEFPQDLKDSIIEAYGHLCKEYGEMTDTAVRSSATAEDLPDASFAGQQETFLNIHGHAALLEACKKCFASLFTNRAISYRVDKGFDHFSIALSIAVQKMVRSDKASSGVMFSIDTESGFKEAVFIGAAWGLGENVVQGAVNPDEYYVFKPTLKEGKKPIIGKELGAKKIKMVYTRDSADPVKNIETPEAQQKMFCLGDDEILKLAEWACIIEEHYSAHHNRYCPMDMEWAKDGETGELFIVQARPETVHSTKDANVLQKYVLKGEGEVLAQGASVGERIGSGAVNIIKDVSNIKDFKKGEVLVTDMTDPDWEPIMKIASAIVTNRGGRVCHAAIISRELGIPCIVGCGDATEKLPDKQPVTVDCSKGSKGYIYNGEIPFDIEEQHLDSLPETRVNMMLNLGNPDQAFELSSLPTKGVGLAREEFIWSNYIKVHPLALVNYDSLSEEVKREVDEATAGYSDPKTFCVEKLAQGIGTIAAAFYPEKVIVRMSDFKSNEYASMIGGSGFEPKEENPMIGWRGASRYYSETYRAAFDLECLAFKKVRDEYGLTNLQLMVPFCRTVEEGRKVIGILAEHGLRQGVDGLQVYAMCEIPSNVLLAEEFLEVFDGFSIGSNDLTQLTLGVDRDSELVAHVYDERNEAIKKLLRDVIQVCNEKGKYVGICGDAPSTFPDFAEFLVREGIQSMSLSPDAFLKTLIRVGEIENE